MIDLLKLRGYAMGDDEFWNLFDKLPQTDPLVEMSKRLSKLSYQKLLKYEIRLRFMLLDELDHNKDLDEPEFVKVLIITLLSGKDRWGSRSRTLYDPHCLDRFDMNAFVNMGHEIFWEKHVINSKSLRDNPAAIANLIYNLDQFASERPSWAIENKP